MKPVTNSCCLGYLRRMIFPSSNTFVKLSVDILWADRRITSCSRSCGNRARIASMASPCKSIKQSPRPLWISCRMRFTSRVVFPLPGLPITYRPWSRCSGVRVTRFPVWTSFPRIAATIRTHHLWAARGYKHREPSYHQRKHIGKRVGDFLIHDECLRNPRYWDNYSYFL